MTVDRSDTRSSSFRLLKRNKKPEVTTNGTAVPATPGAFDYYSVTPRKDLKAGKASRLE